jgi:hypothetical protein
LSCCQETEADGEKVRNFLLGIKDGFTTIWTMQDKWLYLRTRYLFGNVPGDVLRVHAIPDTDSMPISAVLCAFVAGSFAVHKWRFWSYPYLISQVLLFSYSATVGTAFGWIEWLSQTALVIVFWPRMLCYFQSGNLIFPIT